jgi:serine/threonine protein kinase
MSLSPGTRFGSCEIVQPLGAGGMGEVYRAHDAALGRDVAIKVLPASFASDAARVARFEQEAKTLAALNHSNIAHIYGIERASAETGADGESPGTTTALVMELVEGPTLAERIEQGPIPPDEALGIALQIADGLEAAHARGIVHRDLKPANIKLATDGTVKVLDFGIAKALDTRTISGPQAPALTTPAMTEAGIVLGTAQYMSPEQARGKPVDQRADIWAFGCVLYEMLTGQPVFGGEDVTIVLARVLERGANLDTLPATIAPAVKQAIKLCLQKDPKKRVRDIGDVKLALEARSRRRRSKRQARQQRFRVDGSRGWLPRSRCSSPLRSPFPRCGICARRHRSRSACGSRFRFRPRRVSTSNARPIYCLTDARSHSSHAARTV